MIGYLKGKIIYSGTESVILNVGGVGYEVYCSGGAFAKAEAGAECELYTYLQVSEVNGVQLFGFASQEEKSTFLKLISVSGVGPKLALSVLTYMSVNDFAVAVATADVKRLSSVKGLGKKTAERIILELREKVAVPQGGKITATDLPAQTAASGDEDAVVALMTLGFSRSESEKAVLKAKSAGAGTIEEIIMLALKGM